jgi:hypothetical protein
LGGAIAVLRLTEQQQRTGIDRGLAGSAEPRLEYLFVAETADTVAFDCLGAATDARPLRARNLDVTVLDHTRPDIGFPVARVVVPGLRIASVMLEDCAKAWAQPRRPPQVLVVIGARLPRLAWKYAAIAYRLSLLNASVAIQSLYLVATDLGLCESAVGTGNPEHFAAATGLSSWGETSIAEFGFGRAV